jgi:hypothetical protein
MAFRLNLLSRVAAGSVLALASVGGGAAPAAAQTASPTQVRGEISSVDGRSVTVQTREGEVARLELAADGKIYGMAPAKAEAIATDSTIAAAAVPDKEGGNERLRALIVVIFPASMTGSGAGEGYFTFNATPDSAMRTGDVSKSEAGEGGRVVTIRYPQGGATIVIPPEAKVVMLEPGDAGLLKKGGHVFVPTAERQANGSLAVSMVAVGKDGFTPPM